MKKLILTTLQFLSTSFIALGQLSIAQITGCSIKQDTIIYWSAKEKPTKFTYYIQQFRWNKWITWDSVASQNSNDTSKYNYKVSKFIHTGPNQFRIKARNNTPKTVISQTVTFKTKEESNFFTLKGHYTYYIKNPVTFKRNTFYELYNKDGTRLKSGYGQSFFINDLPSDIYYLNFDNKMTEIIP